MHGATVALMVVAVVTLGGCSDDTPLDQRLPDASYSVTNVVTDGFAMSMDASTDDPAVTFGGGQIGVSAACFSLRADYEIDGSGTLLIHQSDPPTGVSCGSDPISGALAEVFTTSGADISGEPGDLKVERDGTSVRLRRVDTD